MDVEQLATSEVTKRISKSNRLKAVIGANEKGTSFDGYIEIYEKENYEKTNVKRVNLQVKGKSVGRLSSKKSFPVEVADINNYKNNGGAIFFVVYVDKEGEPLGIYYSSILPFYAKELLKKKNKSTISVPLKEFPNENDEILELLLNYYQESQKQISSANIELPSLQELQKSDMLDSLTFSYTTFGKKGDWNPSELVGKEIYLYAKTKDNPLPIPVEHITRIDELFTNEVVENPISVNGKQYFDSFKKIESKSSMTLMVGNSVSIITKLNDSNNDVIKSTIKINVNGSLKNRIKDLQFIIDLLQNGYFEVSGIKFPLDLESIENSEIKINKFKEAYKNCLEIKKLLQLLNVKKDLDLDHFTNDNDKNISMLIEAILYNKKITYFSSVPDLLYRMNISNINLLLGFKKTDEGVEVFDFFSKYVNIIVREESDEKTFEVSQFCLLSKEDFIKNDNINYDYIYDNCIRLLSSNMLFDTTNNMLLRMILAYDEVPNDKLYDLMLKISLWICENKDHFSYEIAKINFLQIKKRKNSLTMQDISYLTKLYESTDDKQIKISCLLLMDMKENAKKLFRELDEDSQKTFESYPIAHYLK